MYEPTTDSVTGIIDLSDYKALEEQDSRVNELRLCGLSDDEIRLKLQTEDGNVVRSIGVVNKQHNIQYIYVPICLLFWPLLV